MIGPKAVRSRLEISTASQMDSESFASPPSSGAVSWVSCRAAKLTNLSSRRLELGNKIRECAGIGSIRARQ